MNIDGSVYLVVVIDVGAGFGRGVGYEVYILLVDNEVVVGFQFGVGGMVMLIKMSMMNLMRRLMIVSVKILTELLVLKLVYSITAGYTVMLVLKL